MTKTEYILKRCAGKKVLDLGIIQNINKIGHPNWLHDKICEVADVVYGVDLADLVLPEKYNYIQHDVEKIDEMPYVGHFDIVVAGDIIEHLFNPGMFLENAKELEFNEMIIATPNVMSPKYWTLGKEKCRDDHTCWYSMKTLTQLLEMKGYTIIDKSYGFDQKVNGVRPLIKYLIYKLLPQTGNRLLITATA